jgi:uncharacterized protein with ParB-like and HNH nuclease domain
MLLCPPLNNQECIEAKSIYLEPDYQREVVWDEGRAATLINSILSMPLDIVTPP